MSLVVMNRVPISILILRSTSIVSASRVGGLPQQVSGRWVSPMMKRGEVIILQGSLGTVVDYSAN